MIMYWFFYLFSTFPFYFKLINLNRSLAYYHIACIYVSTGAENTKNTVSE